MPTISMESCAGPRAQSWKKVTGSITVQAGLGPAEARRGQQVPGAVDGLSAPCEVNVLRIMLLYTVKICRSKWFGKTLISR